MMSLDYRPQTLTADDYKRIFEAEKANVYPVIDAIEARTGHMVNSWQLLRTAEVLECPFKAAAPNWQHGRLLYAVIRQYLENCSHSDQISALDIGTAKGFSALCMRWALDDADRLGAMVVSVDVMDPMARVRRNTVAEVDGLKTLPEILGPWLTVHGEAHRIHFEHCSSVKWLIRHPERFHVAFVDGKHDYDTVLREGKMLADRQQSGDIVVFDDVQMPGVSKAVAQLDPYECEYVDLGSVNRCYAIGVRR